MRITVRPATDPEREIDVTGRLVAAIAAELWRCGGGNDVVNWLEAEAHLRRIVAGTPAALPVVPSGDKSRQTARQRRAARRRPGRRAAPAAKTAPES